jgi:U3 small nucleolar RNA-associated protein 21
MQKVVRVFSGHKSEVHLIFPFSSQLLSVDINNELRVWNAESKELYLTLEFDKTQFDITCMMHPITYINKILFGSKQGSMQLWNIKTSKLIYSFKTLDSPITTIQQASVCFSHVF